MSTNIEVDPGTAETTPDPGNPAAVQVAQAYVKLVDRIAPHRDHHGPVTARVSLMHPAGLTSRSAEMR